MSSGVFLGVMDRKAIGFQIRKYRQVKGLTQAALAESVGSDQPAINKIENGKRGYTIDFLSRLASALGVNDYDLLSEKPLIPADRSEIILNFNMPEGEIEGIKVFENPICLGPGYNMDELKPAGYMPIPKPDLPRGYKSDRDRIVCFKTKGYSMEPTIVDDSYVWIDRYIESCQEGDICAFLLPDNIVTVKRLLSHHEDHLIIGADNPDQPGFPMMLKLREAEEISVVRGRVIWVLNRFIEKPQKQDAH